MKHYSSLILLLLLPLYFLTFPGFASAAVDCGMFARNLSLGSSGVEVKALQQLLNSDTRTTVATEGSGSVGNETFYFGLRTKLAVIKFQELYAKDVLTPAGLTHGNGFVGSYSRARLVMLCVELNTLPGNGHVVPLPLPPPTPLPQPISPILPSSTTSPIQASVSGLVGFKSETPVLMFLSSFVGSRGATVTLSMLGLTPTENTVHLDTYTIAHLNMTPDGGLEFVVPQDAPRGKHDLSVTNSKGTSNMSFFVVTDPKIPGPTVSGYTPTSGWLGTTVVVTGTGFTPTNNEVRIGYGWIKGLASSDGKTLQFTVSPDAPGATTGADTPGIDMSVPLWFTVVNENGLSVTSPFTLKI